MNTVLIVEDNFEQLNGLKEFLLHSYNTMNILCATNYEDAKKIIDANAINFFLLDIELVPYSDITGITLGEYIRSLPQHRYTPILFLTARMDQMEAAINKTHCYNYLMKPYRYEVLASTINSLIGSPLLSSELTLKLTDTNGILFRLKPEELYLIQSISKTLILTTKHGTLSSRQYTLTQLLELLPDNFCQCHKSYIVNYKYITSYDKTFKTAYIGNISYRIPVGRKYKENFERVLENDNICN